MRHRSYGGKRRADRYHSLLVAKKRKKKRRRALDEAAYICPSCGERIVIPLDLSAGADQEYVEDCPVCCNPNVIHIELFDDGEPARAWAEAE